MNDEPNSFLSTLLYTHPTNMMITHRPYMICWPKNYVRGHWMIVQNSFSIFIVLAPILSAVYPIGCKLNRRNDKWVQYQKSHAQVNRPRSLLKYPTILTVITRYLGLLHLIIPIRRVKITILIWTKILKNHQNKHWILCNNPYFIHTFNDLHHITIGTAYCLTYHLYPPLILLL